MGTMCHIVEIRRNDIQRQRRLVGMSEMKLLFLYRELENTCEEERCVHGCCRVNGRSGIAGAGWELGS